MSVPRMNGEAASAHRLSCVLRSSRVRPSLLPFPWLLGRARASPSRRPSHRLSRRRQVTVFANLLPGASQAEVQNAMEAEFKNMNAGPEYRGARIIESSICVAVMTIAP